MSNDKKTSCVSQDLWCWKFKSKENLTKGNLQSWNMSGGTCKSVLKRKSMHRNVWTPLWARLEVRHNIGGFTISQFIFLISESIKICIILLNSFDNWLIGYPVFYNTQIKINILVVFPKNVMANL